MQTPASVGRGEDRCRPADKAYLSHEVIISTIIIKVTFEPIEREFRSQEHDIAKLSFASATPAGRRGCCDWLVGETG